MYIIGENIQILATGVKKALRDRNGPYFRNLIAKMRDAGADCIDLNIGPSKRRGHEILPWLVQEAEAVTDLPLCFDTTNLAAIEAACQTVTKAQPIINSTDCTEDRLRDVPAVAKKYNTRLIGLTKGKGMIPVGSMERITLALDILIPHMDEIGFPVQDLIIDPLALTVSGCQEYCPECIEAVRAMPFSWGPPPATNVGLSNVSNAVPNALRPLINQVFLVMLMGAGITMVIADPLDEDLMKLIKVIDQRDESTPVNSLLVKLYDRVEAMEELEASDVDMGDPAQAAVWKTVQVILNKVIYTDSYLR